MFLQKTYKIPFQGSPLHRKKSSPTPYIADFFLKTTVVGFFKMQSNPGFENKCLLFSIKINMKNFTVKNAFNQCCNILQVFNALLSLIIIKSGRLHSINTARKNIGPNTAQEKPRKKNFYINCRYTTEKPYIVLFPAFFTRTFTAKYDV